MGDGDNRIEVRVAARSSTQEVGWAVMCSVRDGKDVTLLAVGTAAVNTAVKGTAEANRLLKGVTQLAILPAFRVTEREETGGEMTVMALELRRLE
jgi:stage V sporulation protein SpoVS